MGFTRALAAGLLLFAGAEAAFAAAPQPKSSVNQLAIHPDADHPLFALPPERPLFLQPQGFAVSVPWANGGTGLAGIGRVPFDPLRTQPAPIYVPRSDFDLRLRPVGFLGLGQAEIYRGQILFTPSNTRIPQIEFRVDRPEAAFVQRF